MELSLRWAERSSAGDVLGNDAALFGIVQGGVHHDLRKRSAEGLRRSASTAMPSAASRWARPSRAQRHARAHRAAAAKRIARAT
jgi:tRNA-guanine family transglycosylase